MVDEKELKGMRMVKMMVVVKVKPEKIEEFLQAMGSLTNCIEIQEGLRKCTIYHKTDDQTGFSLEYEWESQEYLDRYLGGEKFKVLLGALKVLGEKSEIGYRYMFEE